MMRLSFAVWVVVCGLGAAERSVALAEDKPDPAKIVARAIQAMGGEEKLARARAVTWKETGTYFGSGDRTAYTARYSVHHPQRFRMDVESSIRFVMIIDGKRGWMRAADSDTTELDPDQMAWQAEDLWADSLTTLLPLKENDVQLAAGDEIQAEGRPAVGIVVSKKGFRDVKLYFDRDSGLLVRVVQKARSAEQHGAIVTQETTFSNYKEFGGVRLPTRTVVKRDGSPYLEADESEYTLDEKFDEQVFARP